MQPDPMTLTPEAYWALTDLRTRRMRLRLNCADTPELDVVRVHTRDRRDCQRASFTEHCSIDTRFLSMAASYLLGIGFSLSVQAETGARQTSDTVSVT